MPPGFTWVDKPLLAAGQVTSYVVAPILPAGRVVGLLHADHGATTREVDVSDRDVLWAFAEGFGRLYERVVLLERIDAQRQGRQRLGALVGIVVDLLELLERLELLELRQRRPRDLAEDAARVPEPPSRAARRGQFDTQLLVGLLEDPVDLGEELALDPSGCLARPVGAPVRAAHGVLAIRRSRAMRWR